MKHIPGGILLKYKYHYWVCGDIQTSGVNYFETYTNVVPWSTINLLLPIILFNSWHTKQVDYTNTFYQEYLKEEVYIDPPHVFGGSGGISKMLRLIKILYGIHHASNISFDKIRAGVLER